MPFELDRDKEFSHSVLNYLNAGYQGEFAHLNIISQFQPGTIEESEMSELQESLQKVNTWIRSFQEGETILSLDWPKPMTPDAEKAMELLGRLPSHLRQIADELRKLVWVSNFAESRSESIYFLIACVGRYAYSRDNYLRGLLELARLSSHKESIKQYELLLERSEEDVKLAHALLQTYKSSQQQSDHFLHAVFSESVAIPGILRSQAHDIDQLLSVYTSDFNFEQAHITNEDAEVWKQIGLGPVEAGYWIANEIAPQEALLWNQAGIVDYAVAGLWRSWKFPPDVAAAWIQAEFLPADAAMWANAQIPPEEAQVFIKRGLTDPSQIRS